MSAAPEVRVEDGLTIIALGAEFAQINERLVEILRETLRVDNPPDPPRLIVDLSHTKFFGSSFIEILFSLWNKFNTRPGSRFAIVGLSSYCREVLMITHIDTLWHLYPTMDEAKAALKADPAA